MKYHFISETQCPFSYFTIVLHTIPSFARISIKTLFAPPPDDGDGDVADDGDGDDGALLVQAPMKIFTAIVVGLGTAIHIE